MAGQIKSVIHSDYQEVDYLQSSGGQYINTAYVPKVNNVIIELDMAWTGTDISKFESFAGFMYSTSPVEPRLALHKWNSNLMFGANATTGSTTPPVKDERFIYKGDFKTGNQKLYKNGTLVASNTNTYDFATNTCPIYIFARYCPNSENYSYMRLYSCKIYSGSTLLYDFIPVLRKSDSAPGLYDKKSRAFFVGQGSGTLTYGSIVNNDILSYNSTNLYDYQEVLYLRSNGTQYIDTGVIGNLNTAVYIKGRAAALTPMMLFGSRTSATENNINIGINSAGNGMIVDFGDYTKTRLTGTLTTEVFEIYNSKSNRYFNSQTATTTFSGSLTTPSNMLLGACYNGFRTEMWNGEIYSCKIYNGETLIRDFVPVIRRDDNKPGFFDKVNNVFYQNIAPGNDYTYGPLVNIERKIPRAYQEVECLNTNNGLQYINTGYIGNLNTELVADVKWNGGATYASPFGFFSSTANEKCISLYYGTSNGTNRFGSWNSAQIVNASTERVIIRMNKTKLEIKNRLDRKSYTTNVSTAFRTDGNIYFCNRNDNNGTTPNFPFYGSVYRFTIKESGITLHDYIPCYRKSDNKPGFYDIITGTFKTNANTGTDFTLGNVCYYEDELPVEYSELDGIESTGTQYINTLIPGKMSWEYKMTLQQASATSYRNWGVFNQQSYIGPNMSLTYASNQFMLRWETVAENQRSIASMAPLDINKHTVVIENGETVFDGIYKGITAGHLNEYMFDYNMFLFVINPGGTSATASAPSHTKFYEYKVYDSYRRIVQDFIPCLEIGTGKLGMYDKVRKMFFQNAGTGTFKPGNYKTFIQKIDSKGNIPSELYQEVEYLEGTGTQYIDTHIQGNMRYRYTIDFNQTTTSQYRIWGVFNQNDWNEGQNISLTYGSNNWMVRWQTIAGTGANVSLPTIDLNRHLLKIDNGTVIFDGTSYPPTTDHNPNQVFDHSLYLFTINPGGNTPTAIANVRIYEYSVYDGNTLIQNLVPVKRLLDGKPGMFDTASGEFLTNIGTGEFLTGPGVSHGINIVENMVLNGKNVIKIEKTQTKEVIWEKGQGYLNINNDYIPVKDDYDFVPYIECNGTQYIDTGVIPTVEEQTKIIGSFALTDATNGMLQSMGSNYNLNFYAGANVLYFRPSGHQTTISLDTAKHDYTLQIDSEGRHAIIDGTAFNNATLPSTIEDFNFLLGGLNCGEESSTPIYYGKYKIYRNKIYNKGILVRNLIPAVRKSDRVGGMYDLTTRTFLENGGTNNFLYPATGRIWFTRYGGLYENIPSEYTPLQYIDTSGTQWINTEIYQHYDSGKIRILTNSTRLLEQTTGSYLFGNAYTQCNYGYVSPNTISLVDVSYDSSTKLENVYVDGVGKEVNKSWSGKATWDNCPIMIGNLGEKSRPGSVYYETTNNFRFCDCKIWYDDILVRDMIPAKRNSDSEIGMYDLINNVFYTNIGTGTFIEGPAAEIINNH